LEIALFHGGRVDRRNGDVQGYDGCHFRERDRRRLRLLSVVAGRDAYRRLQREREREISSDGGKSEMVATIAITLREEFSLQA